MIPIVLRNYNGSIVEPSKNDVLCGKDTTLARHPGNQKFRAKIQDELPRYLAARSKQDKMKITKSIVQYITIKQGSRFLKLQNSKDKGAWVEIDGQAARDKVSHALRFAARQQKKVAAEHSDDSASHASSEEELGAVPPPPMPGRQEIERDTTNVEKLFAAFDQTLTGTEDEHAVDEGHSTAGPVRRDSANLFLSFLSTVDFEEEEQQQQQQVPQEAVGSSFSFDLGLDLNSAADHAVTQWAACW